MKNNQIEGKKRISIQKLVVGPEKNNKKTRSRIIIDAEKFKSKTSNTLNVPSERPTACNSENISNYKPGSLTSLDDFDFSKDLS